MVDTQNNDNAWAFCVPSLYSPFAQRSFSGFCYDGLRSTHTHEYCNKQNLIFPTILPALPMWECSVKSYDVMPWRHDIMMLHHMTSHHKPSCLHMEVLCLKPENLVSWTSWPWPMTLPVELDLDIIQADIHVNLLVCMSKGSVVRVHTNSHTAQS